MTLRIALFDLETTGFPKKVGHSSILYTNLDSFESARIVQIGMMIYELNLQDESYKLIKSYDKTIKPDDFIIRNAHIHNITQEYAIKNGVSFCNTIYDMMEDIMTIDILISHNIKFDMPILLSELFRYEFGEITKQLKSITSFCTMLNTINVVKKGHYPHKWPKLSELHDFLFKTNSVNEHNALADTKILSKCFWQLYDLNIFSIEGKSIKLNIT